MKKATRFLALLLAMLLALSCAVAEETTDATQTPETETTQAPEDDASQAEENPVLFTFDGQEFRKTDVDTMLNNLISVGQLTNEKDYTTAIDYMIQSELMNAEINARGLDQFTEEEEASFQNEAQVEWENALDSYVSYFLTEDTDEARASTRKNAEDYYASFGITLDVLTERFKQQAAYEKLEEAILEGKNVNPSEEEIQEVFNQYVELDKESYEGNIYTYELYQNYGYEIWYQPSGYRGVLHILLDTDEDLLNAYEDAMASYEESLSSEGDETAATEDDAAASAEATEEPKKVTAEDVEAAKAALLAHHQKEIDDIYARLENGETFESLISVYGTDPGMQNEDYLKNGYAVHADSIMWDAAFTTGAFSEKMQAPGDVSDPVIGSYGIHILYYLRDIPAGPVELSDSIREEICNYLTNSKTSDIWYASLEEWKANHEVVYNEEAIAAVSEAE